MQLLHDKFLEDCRAVLDYFGVCHANSAKRQRVSLELYMTNEGEGELCTFISKSVSRFGSEEGGELFDSALLDSQELFDEEDNDKTFLFTSKDDMEACNLHDRLYIRGDKFSKPTGETTKTDFSYKKVVRNWGYMDVKEQAELPHFKAGLKQMTGVKENYQMQICLGLEICDAKM